MAAASASDCFCVFWLSGKYFSKPEERKQIVQEVTSHTDEGITADLPEPFHFLLNSAGGAIETAQ